MFTPCPVRINMVSKAPKRRGGIKTHSAAVAEVLAVVLLGSLDLSAGNDGAGERGAQEVAVLVDGIALDGAVDNLLDELLLEVLDDHLLGTEGHGLLLDLDKVLLLANIGQEGNNLIVLVDEPFEDGRGIETWLQRPGISIAGSSTSTSGVGEDAWRGSSQQHGEHDRAVLRLAIAIGTTSGIKKNDGTNLQSKRCRTSQLTDLI